MVWFSKILRFSKRLSHGAELISCLGLIYQIIRHILLKTAGGVKTEA